MPRTTSCRSRRFSTAPRSSASLKSKSADSVRWRGPLRHLTDFGLVTEKPRWKRIVFKPSGEALAGPSGRGLDGPTLDQTAAEITEIRQTLKVDVAVVVGGGNFWRGRTGAMEGMDATQSDHIGRLGTVMNALALQDALE